MGSQESGRDHPGREWGGEQRRTRQSPGLLEMPTPGRSRGQPAPNTKPRGAIPQTPIPPGRCQLRNSDQRLVPTRDKKAPFLSSRWAATPAAPFQGGESDFRKRPLWRSLRSNISGHRIQLPSSEEHLLPKRQFPSSPDRFCWKQLF